MEDSTLFRTAAPAISTAVEPRTESYPVTEKASEPVELPPSLYLDSHKPPLVLELIGGVSAYDHFDMPYLSREINTYILEEITRQELSDTREDYQTVLDRALKHLDLPEGIDVYATVEKLVRYFRIQHKLWTALREKEELMAADPLTLSAPKLKRYLEMHHG